MDKGGRTGQKDGADAMRDDMVRKSSTCAERRCYTVKDLQVILDVSRPTVYHLLNRNEFRWFQIGGGKYRISKKSFDEWLDCQRSNRQP